MSDPTVPADPDLALPGDDERAEIERIAVEVALTAAALVVDERPRDLRVDSTKSTRSDIVTVMDLRSQDLIMERIAAARPHDALFGEERGGIDGSSAVTWVVDPIDGTVNYLYDIPAYAVSIAAAVGDPRVPGGFVPFAGAVVNPVTGEVHRARSGGGAWLARPGHPDERVVAAPGPDLALALVGTGFGYAAERRRWQGLVLADVIAHIRDIRREGGAALDLCHVATGRIDAFYETGLNSWDLAAAWVFAREAGVVVGGLGGPGTPSPDLAWAAGPGLADAFSAIVIEATNSHRGV
jgi:myo-inositol-1(or 4)-monophosphatase